MQSILDLINSTAYSLESIYGDDHAQADAVAWWMLEEITGCSQAELLAHKTVALTDEQRNKLTDWVHKHVHERMPLQYVIGTTPFVDLSLITRPPTLIPRPETEEWAVTLINQLAPCGNENVTILDLCTGTGCIALAIAKRYPNFTVVATDIADTALALAKENAQKNHVTNVQFMLSDVYAGLPDHFSPDIIVGNPPYIDEREWYDLDPMVKGWEDKRALVAPDNGFEVIKRIVERAGEFLPPARGCILRNALPQLILEVSDSIADEVAYYYERCGFENVSIWRDLEGKKRVVVGSLIVS